MNLEIRQLNYEELGEAFSLIWRTFLEFIAPS
jgi:hypothetical protein